MVVKEQKTYETTKGEGTCTGKHQAQEKVASAFLLLHIHKNAMHREENKGQKVNIKELRINFVTVWNS